MEFPKTSYTYGVHDGIPALKEPPVAFWPSYSWGWNDAITREGIVRQLDSMTERGIRGIYILPVPKNFRPKTMPTHLDPDYPSPEFCELIRFTADEAEKRGIRLWLYDEGGWPSGSANGRVVEADPSLSCRALTPDGEIVDVPAFAQAYPDLLNPASTKKFLELTHEAYAAAFDGRVGEHMPVAFTDEPHVRSQEGTVPWTPGLAERFRERWGYDLTAHLPALFAEGDADEETKKVRGDYYDLLGELFAENYFLPIREWCHAHGMLSSGHVGGDDVAFGNAKYGYHHILRCLRAMDIPGVDVIWRQAFCAPPAPGREAYAPRCANLLFPRYASSAAHQTGARLALTESYAIYGSGITYDQMRWLWCYQAVRGLNILNPMSMSYSYNGSLLASSGRPTYSPALPGAKDLAAFNLWAARLSYLMSAGKPVADAALYMPLRDIWPGDKRAQAMAERFQDTGKLLEKRGCDYDVIDDDAILAAEIAGGALRIGDARYETIYLPQGAILPDEVRDKLMAFRADGGVVIVCGDEFMIGASMLSDCTDLRVTRRDIDEGRVYLIVNEAFEQRQAHVTFPEESAYFAWELDLMTGERRAVSVQPYLANLPFGACTALLFTKTAPEAADPVEAPAHAQTLSGFRFRRLRQVTLSPHGFVSTPIEEPWQPMEPGDWRERIGGDFSGDTEYMIRFSAPAGIHADYLLDLGEVRYTCEVILNGRSLGSAIFTPFCVRLPKLQAENVLILRVSNTAANIFHSIDFTRWFSPQTIGPYDAIERQFEEESLPSGLYGPVRLLW